MRELSGAPPFLYLQPPGSVSEELLRLLPTSLRPTELLTSGSFALDLGLLGPASGGRLTTWAEETTGLAEPADGSSSLPLPFGGPARNQQPFGAVGSAPVQREVELGLRDYLSFAGAGAVCTASVRPPPVPQSAPSAVAPASASALALASPSALASAPASASALVTAPAPAPVPAPAPQPQPQSQP